MTDAGDDLHRENRILERRLRRLEANVRRMEGFQDSNATLLTRLLNDLDEERARSQSLLRNVLPQHVIDRLEAGEARIADRHDDVTVLFSDFVGFTAISSRLEPAVLVEELDQLFRAFDAICEANRVEKIKTIGDAYLAVGGLTENGPDGTAGIARTALAMVEAVDRRVATRGDWRIRIGIHAGPVIAGVVGASKFVYDIWGDTVNLASRLETTSSAGRIQVSASVAERLSGEFVLEARGSMDLKGKGPTETYFLVGQRP